MKKSLIAVLISGFAYSQVGINTTTPKATLDVVVNSVSSNPEGIIAPRMTGDALRGKDLLYTAAQNAALVYVTAADTAPAGKTIDVTSPGYYYYDATAIKWIKLGVAGGSTPPATAWYPGGNSESVEKTLGTNNSFDLPMVTNGTEKARLTTAGHLGVGTTTPAYGIHLESMGDGSKDNIGITSDTSPSFLTNQTTPISGGSVGSLQFRGTGVTTSGLYSIIDASKTMSALGLNTNGTEKVRITEKGHVGVNTTTPSATLEVAARPAADNLPEGFIPPRFTGDELRAKSTLYNIAQKGAIVFVTAADSAPTGRTINVTSHGYYFYDAGVTNTWIKLITFPSTNYYSLGTAASIEGASQNINAAVDDPSPSIVYLQFPVNRYSSQNSGVTLDATDTVFTFSRAGTYQITATTEMLFDPGTVWNYPASSPGDFWMDMALFIEISHDGGATYSRSNIARHSVERDDNGSVATPLPMTASIVPVVTFENIDPGDKIRVGIRRSAGALRMSGISTFAKNSNIIIQNLAR
ncbi:hypothetical protein [Chryseobacterium aurantiacum]|uniref:hypothetical protein n=1 Tax=Chryseobacterium aurantiacum TaxID=2116499 RepID=UPI000D12A53F|nr:hypothetical protein [Chryseobacterium aurantiacum]